MTDIFRENLKSFQPSDQNFIEIANNIADAVITIDEQSRIWFVNPAVEKIFGYEPEELVGQDLTILMPEEMRELHRKGIQRYLKTRKKNISWSAIELPGLHKSGRPLVLEVSFGEFTQDGERYYTGVARNITERKRIQNELRYHISFLKSLADSLAEGVFAVDFEGNLTFLNSAAEKMLGWKQAELLGKNAHNYFHHKRPDGSVYPAEECFLLTVRQSGEQINNHEDVFTRRDGTMFPVYCSSSPIVKEWEIVGAVVSFHDISERRRAEAERDRLLTLDRQRVNQLRKLAQASLAINSTLSLEDTLQIIADQARKIIGAHQAVISLTVDHNFGQAINVVSFSEKYDAWRDYDEKPTGAGIYTLVCRTNEPMRLTQSELEAHPAWRGFSKHADKHPPMRGWLAAPLRSSDGQNMGLIQLSDRYIDEFTEDDEAILVQLAQMSSIAIENARLYHIAQESNRLKDDFLATVSHELRTPLNAILGWTNMLRAAELDEQSIKHAVEVIERNARVQSQLIEDLLDVSRIISGKIRLDVQPVNPAVFIDAAIDSITPAAGAKGVRIQKVLDTSVGLISGDAGRLQQVVWNLLTNAVKFTPKGGRVQVMLERVHSHIEITVSDTGVGIEPDFLPFVFDRFRQADQASNRIHGGLGLGLSIVRHIVELHGGEVSAYSEGTDKGSVLTVKLPLIAIQPYSDEKRIHPAIGGAVPVVEPAQQVLNGVKILAVDDELDTLELLDWSLKQYGAEVFTADSTAKALELLAGHRPDLLISDIGMPGEDGYQLIKKIRALAPEQGGKTPAIALTAYARIEDRVKVLDAGYQMHVAKPVAMAELITVVKSLIERRA